MDSPDPAPRDDEVFEHIPWSQLSEPSARPRTWIVYIAAGAIATAAVGAMVMRSWTRPAVESPAVTPVAETVPSTPTPPATLPVPETAVFSEADLMAVVPGGLERLAAVRAEWFVVDYFSSGGNPAGNRAVAEALPADAMAGVPEAKGASFVDWAATVETEALDGERYRAKVLFRMLGMQEDGSYARLPVRAVDILVDVDGEGAASVVDLPMPAARPASAGGDGWEFEGSEAPDAVRAAALEVAAGWGTEAEFVQAGFAGGLWRVLVRVADEAGTSWPVVVWLTAAGVPTWPEW